MKEAVRMLQLLLLCAAYPAARAICPLLDGSPGLFHERVEWIYDKTTHECLARKIGSLEYTSMRKGEAKTLTSLSNDCLKFACGAMHYGDPEFSLYYPYSGCPYRGGCRSGGIQSEGTCVMTYYCDVDIYNTSRVVDEGGQLVTGQFTVYSRHKCAYNAASGPCPLDQCFDFRAPKNTDDVCRPFGTIFQKINHSTGQPYDIQCQEKRPCDDDTSFLVWGTEIQDITTPTPAPPSTTTSVPPSPETTTEAPETEPPVTTVPTTEAPETEPPVITVPTTEGPEIEPPVITVPTTEGPEIEPPVITVRTTPEVPTVIFATLDTTKCRPSKRTCKFSDNTLGCKYRRQCYPVNTQIAWDDCTQFECHGSADGSQGSDFPRPTWLPRYIGCYGPSGCLTFGQKVRDAETNALYNCTYTMGELGFPVPEFRIVTEEGDEEEEDMEVS